MTEKPVTPSQLLNQKQTCFCVKCPVCSYVATSVKRGVEEETMLAHMLWLHMPEGPNGRN